MQKDGGKSCIILAAGDGKRMKSDKPKVLMEVLFKPMLEWVIDSAVEAGIDNIAVIVGNNADLLEKELEKHPGIKTFLQSERKGTGHAVMQAESFLSEIKDSGSLDGNVLILCGDAPFIDPETIGKSYKSLKALNLDAAVITADIENPEGYGRILRNGDCISIVENKDCTDEQRKITEVNSGAYWFNAAALLDTLPKLTDENKNGEYYLTDTIGLLPKSGAYKTDNSDIVLGANDRRGLRQLNKIAAESVIGTHLDNGVDITGESFIGRNVIIGKDTVILPGTIIKGDTVIGKNSIIGPNTVIENCKIGSNVTLNNVQAFESTIEDNAKIGPFVHIRPNSVLQKGVKIGDFVEVKNSVIGEKTSIAHLTYIGDSDVGNGVNFGCGCVTANYDGIHKYRTTVGDNAFIGCNTNLIAPVKIGENAMTAAGSTVAEDIPADSLAIERGPLNIKENFKKNHLRKKKQTGK
ncbi:MAG: bifunctional UDP-N-acetylglucosamine diphosphorylase/glucosamine-1-phosphate N-acetyltransferase GlmU [Oscillospiraceae bacterium]|nr:bifunctional UDP-N-acetylglucosamine diphosphorylase/glucosamine-1-phosphate N-acetyltransferase GlmU [Oscillospiraceae bacterium]